MDSRRFMFILALLIVLIAAACGPAAPAATPTPPASEASIQLSWVPNIEFAGLFMAEDEGFYAAEGLNVSILPGGYDANSNYIDAIDRVLSGEALFGITEGSELLVNRAEGQDLVAVMTIYQRHPFALISRADSEIMRPQDLVGATVEMGPKSMPLFLALLKSQNIDPNSIDLRPRDGESLQRMFAGEVDVVDDWLINEPGMLGEINTIVLSDYGIDAYPDVIFTTQATINNSPDIVQRFVNATVRGLQAAAKHPDRAVEITMARNAELELQAQQRGMQRSLPLLQPSGTQPGMMTPTTWNFMHQLLLDQNIIDAPLDIGKAYNLTFIERAYAAASQ